MALLEVKNISKFFGGLKAVHKLSFSLEKGELLGMIGPNGAGKTTAFNMIAGYFAPDAGEVFFNGEKITGLRPWDVCRKGIVRTFQLSKPFGNLTVFDNIMVGTFYHQQNRLLARKKAEEIMEFIEMTGQRDIEGYNLTAFDRKKLELGRALATGPQLLLLDEVVAGANPHEAAAMMQLIKRVQKNGITILIVEHVMKVIMGLSDRLVVLHHGEKLAEGSPDEISHNEKVLKAYLGEKYARTRNS
jgi:branched-chain amino acid transport system ATP-binding protein